MAHRSLAKGVGLGARSKEVVNREWDNLAARLNAHGRGSTKSGHRWKRYWADIKSKAKARLAAIKEEAARTGGGPATLPELSETDKKILAIIGEGAVHGDIQHRVPLFTSSQHGTAEPETQPMSLTQTHSSDDDEEMNEASTTESPPPSAPASFQLVSPSTRGHTKNINNATVTTAAPVGPRPPVVTARPIVVRAENIVAAPSGLRRPLVTARRIFDTAQAPSAAPGGPLPPTPVTTRTIVDTSTSENTAAEAPGGSCSTTARPLVESSVPRRPIRQPRQSSSSTVTRRNTTDQRVDPSWVVELESRRVEAESRLAAAATVIAEAARTQAEAARMQAEAARTQAEAARMQAEAARTQAEAARLQAEAFNKLLELLSKKN